MANGFEFNDGEPVFKNCTFGAAASDLCAADGGPKRFAGTSWKNSEVRRLPNAVIQTGPSNCFQACVATVMGLPIDEVPNSCDGATWDWDAFQDWLSHRGFQAIAVDFGNGGTICPVRKPVKCIVIGESPRECKTGRHAVVGELLGLKGFRLLHDPHPSELWINGEPTHAVFFVGI